MQSKPPSLKFITEKINSVLIQDTRIVAAYLLWFPLSVAVCIHKAILILRFIAVHQYQEIEIKILQHIAKEGWKDFVEFCHDLGLKIDPDKRK